MKKFFLKIVLLLIAMPAVAQFYQEPDFHDDRILYERMGQKIPGVKKVKMGRTFFIPLLNGSLYFHPTIEITCDTAGNTIDGNYIGWGIDAPYHSEIIFEYDSLGRKTVIQERNKRYIRYTEKRSYVSDSHIKWIESVEYGEN